MSDFFNLIQVIQKDKNTQDDFIAMVVMGFIPLFNLTCFSRRNLY